MHPGDSCTGKFYGAAKLHKVDLKEQIGNLPIKPYNLISTHQVIITQSIRYWDSSERALKILRFYSQNGKRKSSKSLSDDVF